MQPNISIFDIFCIRRKFLVYNLILRNLKIRYRKSFFGILWTVLIPASNALVYFIVFQFIMRVQLPNYLYFVLSGLIPWTFFSAALLSGMETLVWNHGILNKVPVPPYVFPLSEVLTGFINFLFAIPILLVVAFSTHAIWGWQQLYVIYLILLILLQAHSIALMLSYLYVYLRDLKHAVVILLQIWFYLTPILYSREMVPEKYQILISFNPIGKIFEGIHQLLVLGKDFNGDFFYIPTAWTIVLFIAAFFVTRRFNTKVVESL